jgi:N-acetylmuramic acid 6-phosphate (MurNAc-6-P) etherase
MVLGMNNTDKIMFEVKKHGVHGFVASEVAAYLLQKAGGDLKLAILMAATPIKINGKAVW